jgi:sugar lactone lactonase YvrE
MSAQAVTANEAFDAVWSATDRAVENGTASYSWFWGPTIRAQRFEWYTESPDQQREVRYYDKSRMEINNPGGDPNNIYYVTNGLLTVELVTGQLKRGDNPNDFEQRQPANQLVAGDPLNNPGTPSYATFGPHVTVDAKTNRSPDKTGQPATAYMSGGGQVSTTESRGVTLANYQSITGHNIASVFWDWFNNPSSGFRPDIGIDWLYTAGLPISEPYWIDSTVGGSTKRVLVQLFERRVLTYTDSNNDPYRIEWGNIGMHYQGWREAPAGPAPCPDSSAGTYLYVADTLNDRIQKFDGAGNYVCEWYGDYDLDGPSARPQALAVDNQNNLYVNALGRVEKYDQRGRYLGDWGTDINAWDMALDSQGYLYITDVASSSVKKYDQSGNLVDEWGSLGTGNGQFDSLTGIDIDAQNNVYIADRNNHRIQKFTSSGDYLDQWNADGVELDLWGFPASVAVDSAGNSYASSSRIYKFDADGGYLDVFGESNAIIGIADIVVAPNGDIYGIENIGVEIYRYTSNGDLIDSWGGSGSDQGQFNGPRGIAAASR